MLGSVLLEHLWFLECLSYNFKDTSSYGMLPLSSFCLFAKGLKSWVELHRLDPQISSTPPLFVSSQQDVELHLWSSGSCIFSAILGYYLKRFLCQPLYFTQWFLKAFVSNWNSLVSSRIVFLIPVRGFFLDVPEPPQPQYGHKWNYLPFPLVSFSFWHS